MCSLSKEQSIVSRETIQNDFCFRIMPLFRLQLNLHQAPHSQALAPACGALCTKKVLWIMKCKNEDFEILYPVSFFNNQSKDTFWKHCVKRGKGWKPAFSAFPTVFSILSKKTCTMLATLELLSLNAYNLGRSKILSFSKEIRDRKSRTFFAMGWM